MPWAWVAKFSPPKHLNFETIKEVKIEIFIKKKHPSRASTTINNPESKVESLPLHRQGFERERDIT